MAMEQPISRDGVVLKVGMKVAHFLDEWDEGGTIVFIEHDEKREMFNVMFRSEQHGRADYWPDLLYATPEGMRRGKLEDAKKSVLATRMRLMEDEARVEKLTAEVEADEKKSV